MKPLLVANWKMNIGLAEAAQKAKAIDDALEDARGIDIVICPSFPSLPLVAGAVDVVQVGAQNLHPDEKGNLTGEVSVSVVRECASYVILGHSERRANFAETDDFIHRKVMSAADHGIIPIFCFGETASQRAQGKTNHVIEEQLESGLKGFDAARHEIVLAYEPVWAISGKAGSEVATPEEISKTLAVVKEKMTDIFGSGAKNIRILYGGSTAPENAHDIFSLQNVSGALVGGASLEPDSFIAMVHNLIEVKNV